MTFYAEMRFYLCARGDTVTLNPKTYASRPGETIEQRYICPACGATIAPVSFTLAPR